MMKKNLLVGAVTGLLFLTLTACSTGKTMNGEPVSGSDMTSEGEMMDETKMVDETEMMDDNKIMDGSEMMNSGSLAPDFEMMDLNGNTVRLSGLRGEKVYLKYWASWCPICLGGLEDINTLSGEDNGFRILTIVAPGQKGEKGMEDFKTWFSGVENTENITVLFDTDGAYGAQAGVRGYPTSEYIGSDGVLVKLVPGHADNDTIKFTFETIK
ncbi:MAG: redoxin family protein [Enterocloster asparagiformis]|nr:redoxin family protein [Enterocloster asparagiformis]